MTFADNDFPPPPAVAELAESSRIAEMREAYEASPDFAAMRSEYVIARALGVMNGLARHDAEGVAWACYDWLQDNEAGMPYVAIIEGTARDDARFWAETAHPAELECYALAAMNRLGGIGGGSAMFATRQIKRLAGALFRRMSPDEQAAFANWIAEQMKGDKE